MKVGIFVGLDCHTGRSVEVAEGRCGGQVRTLGDGIALWKPSVASCEDSAAGQMFDLHHIGSESES